MLYIIFLFCYFLDVVALPCWIKSPSDLELFGAFMRQNNEEINKGVECDKLKKTQPVLVKCQASVASLQNVMLLGYFNQMLCLPANNSIYSLYPIPSELVLISST